MFQWALAAKNIFLFCTKLGFKVLNLASMYKLVKKKINFFRIIMHFQLKLENKSNQTHAFVVKFGLSR